MYVICRHLNKLYNNVTLKLERRQRSGIGTIKYHTWPRTSYGESNKTQENKNITYKTAKRSALLLAVNRQAERTDKKYDRHTKTQLQKGSAKEASPWKGQHENELRVYAWLMVPSSPLFLLWIMKNRCLVCMKDPLFIIVSYFSTYKLRYEKEMKVR